MKKREDFGLGKMDKWLVEENLRYHLRELIKLLYHTLPEKKRKRKK